MKKIFLILAMIIATLSLASCWTTDSNREMAQKQETIMQEINKQVGMPAIRNFQEKKLAKMIFELRDQEKLVTYTYITAKNTWVQKLLCKSIWYGLPYSIQYTNPMKQVREYSDATALPQADPNGLFMPEWLSATWVMCIDPKDWNPRPVYVENEIIVSPFKL